MVGRILFQPTQTQGLDGDAPDFSFPGRLIISDNHHHVVG